MLSEIHSTIDKILGKHLRNVISRYSDHSDFYLLQEILKCTALPDDIFDFIANCSSVESYVLDHIIKVRLYLETRIQAIIDRISDLEYEIISAGDLNNIIDSDNLTLLPFEKDYIFTLLHENSCSDMQTRYPADNIKHHYKSTQSLLGCAIRKVIHLADYEMLRTFYECMQNNNIHFKFEYGESDQHYDLYKWLIDNIVKGCTSNNRLGWKCGPDSGKWPSTSVQNYIKTLAFLYELK